MNGGPAFKGLLCWIHERDSESHRPIISLLMGACFFERCGRKAHDRSGIVYDGKPCGSWRDSTMRADEQFEAVLMFERFDLFC